MKKYILFLLLFVNSLFSKDLQEQYYLKDFRLKNYLGTWYEIVRKDHYFERNLDFVTATYTLKSDGSIEVLNKGFYIDKNKKSEIIGKAKQKYENTENILKVSFFGSFYSDYIILDYDNINYSWAIVIGKNDKYLWILSRKPKLDEELLTKLLRTAENNGISLDNLIYVKQFKQP